MTHVLHLGLSNALVAGLIAVAAAVVTWRGRCRPALAYGLWLLVLVKLVTPPLVSVPLSWPAPEPEPEPAAELSSPAVPEWPSVEAAYGSDIEMTPDATPADWAAFVAGAWLAGSLAFAALAAWRVARLTRWLRSLSAAPRAWQERVERLADRIGLRRPPRVRVAAHGAVPPLVVGLAGRAVLVFPLGLWDRLEESQRDAVLLHELAHLRRGDHRVRLLELAALTLYWWLPLAWWASRRLREAEEECCDTWVTWAAPDARPAYAAALVETVAFLSGQSPSLPIGASGAGPVVAMKRRLSMILREKTPRGLSRLGWAMMLGALALMPLMPTLVRSEPKPAREGETAVLLDGKLGIRNTACVACHGGTKATEDNHEDLHGRIIRLMDEMKKQRDQAAKTEKELRSVLDKFEKAQEKPKANKATEQERLDREVKRLQEMVDLLKLELENKKAKPRKEEEVFSDKGNLHFANSREFQIPFRFPSNSTVTSATLFARSDTEKKWKLVDRASRSGRAFNFTAPGDGVYQLAIRSEGPEADLPERDWKPAIVVVVDTIRPVIRATFTNLSDGSFTLQWSIEEAHPDLRTLQADYRLEGEKVWRKLAIFPHLAGAEKFSNFGKVAEVRLRMRDKAGNEGEAIVKR